MQMRRPLIISRPGKNGSSGLGMITLGLVQVMFELINFGSGSGSGSI